MRKSLFALLALTLMVACSTTAEKQQVGNNADVTTARQNKTLADLAIGGVT